MASNPEEHSRSEVCTASRDGRVVVFDINAGELPACLVSDIEASDKGQKNTKDRNLLEN